MCRWMGCESSVKFKKFQISTESKEGRLLFAVGLLCACESKINSDAPRFSRGIGRGTLKESRWLEGIQGDFQEAIPSRYFKLGGFSFGYYLLWRHGGFAWLNANDCNSLQPFLARRV